VGNCACYKLQIAHYEAMGIDGLSCYRDTIAYAHDKGALVIGDVKRGDIASTGDMYALAHMDGEFEADMITVNPYMGYDAISPYLPYIENKAKSIFILIRTSNKSAKDFQDLDCHGQPLYIKVASAVASWGERYKGKCGYSAIGGVVGATKPVQLGEIRQRFESLFLLVPGYGAQGAKGKDVALAFHEGNGAIVNASRSIIGAYRNHSDGEKHYASYARKAAMDMKKDIESWLSR
jgi:orotidine-5'-phosphate decarboxylase